MQTKQRRAFEWLHLCMLQFDTRLLRGNKALSILFLLLNNPTLCICIKKKITVLIQYRSNMIF